MTTERIVTYKEPTQAAINKGWTKIKIVHMISETTEYKEYFYTNQTTNPFSGHYIEHLYRTQWIKHRGVKLVK